MRKQKNDRVIYGRFYIDGNNLFYEPRPYYVVAGGQRRHQRVVDVFIHVEDSIRIIAARLRNEVFYIDTRGGDLVGYRVEHELYVSVYYGHAACARPRAGAGREVDGRSDIAVLYELAQSARRHDRAVVLRLLCGRAEVRHNGNALDPDELGRGEVGDIRVYLAALYRGDNVLIDAKLAARQVDDVYAVLHFGDGFCVDDAARTVGKRRVQRDVIGLFENAVEAVGLGDIVVEPPRRIDGYERIEAEHVHAQPYRIVADLHAYRAEPDDAERFAEYLVPGKSFFAFFDLSGNIVAGERARPLDAAYYIARGEEERAHGEFFDRVGVSSRRIEHDDAALGVLCDGDIIDAGASARDRDDAFRQVVAVHVERSEYDCGRLGGFICDGIAVAERIGGACRYRVKLEYLGFFHIFTLCLFAKLSHVVDKRIDALLGHRVVNGRAHSADQPMSFERNKPALRRALDESVVKLFARRYERHVHHRARGFVDGIAVELRAVDVIVKLGGFALVYLLHSRHAAALFEIGEHFHNDVGREAGRRVVKALRLDLIGVAQHDRAVLVGAVGKIVPDDDDGNARRSDILLRARINKPELRHIDGFAQYHRRHIAYERYTARFGRRGVLSAEYSVVVANMHIIRVAAEHRRRKLGYVRVIAVLARRGDGGVEKPLALLIRLFGEIARYDIIGFTAARADV